MQRENEAFAWQALSAIGLGGNVGDVAATMAAALDMLDEADECRVVAVSSLYRTPPWGNADQAAFVNACALVETDLSPRALLDLCLEVERRLKRDRRKEKRWGPRTIDLDVLTYGQTRVNEPDLVLPHPRMTERGFVLEPLAEIAPEMQVAGMAVRDWRGQADLSGIEKIAAPGWNRQPGPSGQSRR